MCPRPARSISEVDVGHNLKLLPANKVAAYKDMDLQCTKCGSVFLINVAGNTADFLLDCKLEQGLRERDPEKAKELPILVKEE